MRRLERIASGEHLGRRCRRSTLAWNSAGCFAVVVRGEVEGLAVGARDSIGGRREPSRRDLFDCFGGSLGRSSDESHAASASGAAVSEATRTRLAIWPSPGSVGQSVSRAVRAHSGIRHQLGVHSRSAVWQKSKRISKSSASATRSTNGASAPVSAARRRTASRDRSGATTYGAYDCAFDGPRRPTRHAALDGGGRIVGNRVAARRRGAI